MPPSTLAVAVAEFPVNNKQTNSENYVANSLTKHLQKRAKTTTTIELSNMF